jgi:hypothetical protein
MSEYRRADYELRQVEDQIRQATDCLHDREGYTTALTNFLESVDQTGQVEAAYKKRLAGLQAEIRAAEADLQEACDRQHPAVAAGLLKEKAYLVIDIQRTLKAIDLSNEETRDIRRQLTACTMSSRYRRVVACQGRLEDLGRKKVFLRQLVDHNRKAFDATRLTPPGQTPDVGMERVALSGQLDLDEGLNRVEEKLKRRPRKWQIRLARAIDTIEEFNARLVDCGMADQVVDVEALRAKYLSVGNSADGPEVDSAAAQT